MPSAVLESSAFEVNKITFGKHKPNPNGGYNIEISVGDTSSEVLIQTPKMRTPFGISTDKTNPFKKALDVSFQGIEKSETQYHELECYRNVNENILILIKDTKCDYGDCKKWIELDKSTAIKLSRELRKQIAAIEEL